MNKIEAILIIILIAVVCYVGALVYYEMAVELESHPEITDIGSPPVITDLRLVAVTVLGAVVVCSFALKFGGSDEEKNEKEFV